MALPVIKHPTYTITVPSTTKDINLRPFTVQEEKLLLMAKSSGKTSDIIASVKQVIQNCVVETIDVDKLSTFDIEYLFLKLRSKSIGEIVDLEYNDPDTDDTIKFKVNLEDIQIKHHEGHSNKIIIHEDIGLIMRYPTLEEIGIIEGTKSEDAVYKVLFKCITTIFDTDKVYSEFTEKELEDFLNSLPLDAMGKIKQFFDTMPSLEHTVTLKNKEGKTKEIVLKGISSFFT